MPEAWTFLPTDALDFEKRKTQADEWATTQRARVAGQWASEQRRIGQSMIAQFAPQLAPYLSGPGLAGQTAYAGPSSSLGGPGGPSDAGTGLPVQPPGSPGPGVPLDYQQETPYQETPYGRPAMPETPPAGGPLAAAYGGPGGPSAPAPGGGLLGRTGTAIAGQITSTAQRRELALQAIDKMTSHRQAEITPEEQAALDEETLSAVGLTSPFRIGGLLTPGASRLGRNVPAIATEAEKLADALTLPPVPGLEKVESAANRLIREIYDRLYPLKALSEAAGQTTETSAYNKARVVPGAVAAGMNDIEQLVLPELAKVRQYLPELEQIMVGRRMGDLQVINPQAKLASGVTNPAQAIQQIETRIGPQATTQVRAVVDRLYQLNDDLVLKPALAEGLISQADYQAFKAKWPHYIPFYRADFDFATGVVKTGGSRPTDMRAAFTRAIQTEGSDRKIVDPLAAWQAQIIRTRTQIARNQAARQTVRALNEVDMVAVETGPNLQRAVPGLKRAIPTGAAEDTIEQGIIHFRENGQLVVAQVPKLYADIAQAAEAEPIGGVLNLLRLAAAPLRAGAITYNPAFVIVNPIRDATSAWFREGLVPLSPDYLRGMKAAIARNADFTQAANAGVLMSGITEISRGTQIRQVMKRLGPIQFRNARDILLLVPRGIARANQLSEEGTRVAVFQRLRRQGVPELAAAIRARDATVDFAKAGNTIKAINTAIPFTNAGIQGLANIARSVRDRPLLSIARVAPLAFVSVLARVNNSRFETSKMIPDYEYANNWIFQFGEGTRGVDPKHPGLGEEKFPIYAKIPKGPEGAMLLAPVESMLTIAWGQDDRSATEILLSGLGQTARAANPLQGGPESMIPSMLAVIPQMASNSNWFTGRPIVPQAEQMRPPGYQYGPQTSRTAVLASRGTTEALKAAGIKYQISPRMIDFAISAIAAGGGQTVTGLADTVLDMLGVNVETPGAAVTQERTPIDIIRQAPIVRRFVGVSNNRQSDQAYQQLNAATSAAQQMAWENPEVRRLGVNVAPVGQDVKTIDLTPAERAQYQEFANQRLEREIDTITARPEYARMTDTFKKKNIQMAIDRARTMAATDIIRQLGSAEIQKRQRLKAGVR